VNGRSVTSCRLELGDELRIGGAVFFITKGDDDSQESASALEQRSTITLSQHESTFLSSQPKYGSVAEQSRSYSDLQSLFRLSVDLSYVTSTKELIAILSRGVTTRFQPDSAWLLLLHGQEEAIFWLAGPQQADPPRDFMLMTLENRTGALFPKVPESSSGVSDWVLTAPLCLGNFEVGVLAVRSEKREQAYNRNDLDFLVALCYMVSPFFKAIERLEELKAENLRLLIAEKRLGELIGSSDAIVRVKRMTEVASASLQTVLISGDTGTGKELVANLLHKLSDRRDGPFVTVNCAAIPKDLFESEIFGYEKGAFTGATTQKTGLMEQSNQGTLFLDEIGDLSLDNQAKILRAVDIKRFRRIGGNKEIEVDFRLVVATNKDLPAQIRKGGFRDDLYHRINTIQIQVPPLRDRRSDIPELAQHFLAMCPEAANRELHFSPPAMEYLLTRSWPGNVRELKNAVQGAVALSQTNVIEAEYLRAVCSADGGDDEKDRPCLSLADAEKLHITKILKACDGNVVEAARRLGIGKSTLYNKLVEYGLKQ
jgi:DNA-binding NtrC family response regulator